MIISQRRSGRGAGVEMMTGNQVPLPATPPTPPPAPAPSTTTSTTGSVKVSVLLCFRFSRSPAQLSRQRRVSSPVTCKVCQSLPCSPLTHGAQRRVEAVEEAKLPPGPGSGSCAHFCAAASWVCASLRLGTGESGAGRRMWFFHPGRACAPVSALEGGGGKEVESGGDE